VHQRKMKQTFQLSVIPEECGVSQFPDENSRKVDAGLARALESLRQYQERKLQVKKFASKINRILMENDREEGEEQEQVSKLSLKLED
jgi:hypothetical protein